jgi:error-prone DNA polymerase
VWLRADLPPSTIEHLAQADAFRSLGLDRRDALWAARGLNRIGGQEDLPLFARAKNPADQSDFALPPMIVGEHVVEDYRMLGLSLKAHPAALLRGALSAHDAVAAERLAGMRTGARTRVAGLVLVRQRPGTAAGVIFMTLEDETGVANIIVWPKVYERFRPQVLGARLCAVDGVVQCESGVIHVIAERLHDISPLLARLSDQSAFADPSGPTDEVRNSGRDLRTHPRNVRHDLRFAQVAEAVMPKGRNFH